MNRLALFREDISRDTGIIVVIPAFDEPGIIETISSLNDCHKPRCGVEVIVLLNAPSWANGQQVENNMQAEKNLKSWMKGNSPFFRLLVFNSGKAINSRWGVGMARKSGMDEALYRLTEAGNHDGVITALDGDCTVAKNYFTIIEKELVQNDKANAASLFFEHRDLTSSTDRGNAILLYELHLRYYFQAMKYCGYPWVTHTVGSSMAVKAGAYRKCGGMSTRQAGEDFYFIQKLIPLGGYINICNTTVYPSGRASNRVPFGTGKAVSQILESGGNSLLTYNIRAFEDLKSLFSSVGNIRELCMSDSDISGLIPLSLRNFITPERWQSKIGEIVKNTSSVESFRKRFFQWFNMFMVVKYLNHSHSSLFKKVPVEKAVAGLFEIMGTAKSDDTFEMLLKLRDMEKQATNVCSFVS